MNHEFYQVGQLVRTTKRFNTAFGTEALIGKVAAFKKLSPELAYMAGDNYVYKLDCNEDEYSGAFLEKASIQ